MKYVGANIKLNLDVVCDVKCVCGKNFTRLRPFEFHLGSCPTMTQEKQGCTSDQKKRTFEVLRHLRNQASKQVDQYSGIKAVMGHNRVVFIRESG